MKKKKNLNVVNVGLKEVQSRVEQADALWGWLSNILCTVFVTFNCNQLVILVGEACYPENFLWW